MAKKVNPLKFFNDQNNTRVNKMQEGGSPKMKTTKKKLTSSKTANDPNSRINKSLRKWKC